MKANKLKLLSISICCFVVSLSEAQCAQKIEKNDEPTKNDQVGYQRVSTGSIFTTEAVLNIRPVDTRYRIERTEEWPNCLFGQIITSTKKGSGTLVGPNIVLTAAHVLYDKVANKETNLNSIHFYPAKNRWSTPYGEVKVTTVYYPEAYKTDQHGYHDWALLILEKNIGHVIQENVKEQGWFNLKACSNDELKGRPIHVVGYPGEKQDELWAVTGSFRDIGEHIISYELDTTRGQSGGGVLADFNGKKYIVATHQSGDSNTFNCATRWTMDKHQKYLEFTDGSGQKNEPIFFAIRDPMIYECINQYKVLTKKDLTYRELVGSCRVVLVCYVDNAFVGSVRDARGKPMDTSKADIYWLWQYGNSLAWHAQLEANRVYMDFPIKPESAAYLNKFVIYPSSMKKP